MPFSSAAYDPETLALLTRAFEDAWREVTVARVAEVASDGVRTALAIRIMIAANAGERDPERLRLLALQAIDGRSADN